MLAEPPLFSQTVALSFWVIMAVFPHSCLFGAGPNRKGGCVVKDMPNRTPSSVQPC